ncbi:TPA: H-NS family nucleoid-associated regulatory protein [Stenotrophomonas maltophilia]|nr:MULTISPECIES: H-NS family nucleoid-associated regulatory protein [Stenotrophomonas]MCO5735887.1 H-NS histone family protein [Stenotrophomonas maltophilia]MCZ7845208.1 H-NS histone family protein [Stenotrophomonas maltophilia]MDG9908535.1 H-NS histone family protein [Stenotrophomonas maltophilia]MDG9940439.1 H-NS histone family protein [Stenotrophomonas maltophilia]MDH0560414.1 H-NS histone family protein [Stenotrophomonas maltophilia]
MAKLIGETIDAKPAHAANAAPGPRKGRKLGKVAPKYRLPTGETWAGRDLAPKAFTAWAKSAEGKAWAQANPGAKFPRPMAHRRRHRARWSRRRASR